MISTNKELIEHLKNNTQVIKSKEIEDAFEKIDRANFVPDDYKVEMYEDYPLPIGPGQTISQPTTVAFMLELLDLKKGEKVLDVGSGSGWATALMAHIVGESGEVSGVEIVPELVSLGKNNLKKYDFKNVKILQSGDEKGLPQEAPFDKILVSAAADEMSKELVSQLKIGGMMVMPVKDSLWRIIKKEDSSLDIKKFPGFAFVPLK